VHNIKCLEIYSCKALGSIVLFKHVFVHRHLIKRLTVMGFQPFEAGNFCTYVEKFISFSRWNSVSPLKYHSVNDDEEIIAFLFWDSYKTHKCDDELQEDFLMLQQAVTHTQYITVLWTVRLRCYTWKAYGSVYKDERKQSLSELPNQAVWCIYSHLVSLP
jgi:hypothetical protein